MRCTSSINLCCLVYKWQYSPAALHHSVSLVLYKWQYGLCGLTPHKSQKLEPIVGKETVRQFKIMDRPLLACNFCLPISNHVMLLQRAVFQMLSY